MSKIIFTDFDGTLFDPKSQKVKEGTWIAFEKAKENGAITCLITGRPKDSFDRIFEEGMLDAFSYIATDNGARLYEVENKALKPLYINLIPQEIVLEINEYINNIGCSAVHYGINELTKTRDTDIENNKRFWKDEIKIGIQDEAIQINLDGLHPDFLPEWQQNWYPTMTSFSIEAGKSIAVEYIKNLHPNKYSYAFGDESNDIKMFESVDMGIGMHHSTDDLKPYAKQFLEPGYNVPDFIKTLI